MMLTTLLPIFTLAQGWPADYGGVMLQGFYWDSYKDSKWTNLTEQADELSKYFDLIWVPQSGWCGSTTSMGYNDIYWYKQRSAFGSEDELKAMIAAYKERGTGIIADVVINHRGGATRWTDFPTETNPLDGKEYSMGLSDICSTDEYNTDSGAKSERETYGEATGAKDTGDDFDGCRDLDHTSANVQENCKAYTKYLLEYLGYAGFRYDMVKGYGGKYVGMYNAYSAPTYSVGEYWDGVSSIKSWIEATKTDGAVQSAAFDFPMKYLMTDNKSNYANWYNATGALAFDDTYKRYAVTFIDNHDTYERTDYGSNNMYKGYILAANAWMLASPGTPCVFLPHWQEHKSEIGAMIKVRKALGITNTSTITKKAGTASYLVAEVEGTNGTLYVAIGTQSAAKAYIPDGYTKVIGGSSYAYYADKAVNLFTVSTPSGNYDDGTSVTITPSEGTTIVYTTDGTEPTATNGTQTSSATTLDFTSTTTLKVGILTDGAVIDTETYEYTIEPFSPYTITVYVCCPEWSPLYFYAWDDTTSLLGNWPGTQATQSTTIDGETWYYQQFDITASDYVVNFIFNNGSGKPQTVDITDIDTDKYFKLGEKDGDKYDYQDVTSQYSAGIDQIEIDNANDGKPVKVYTLTGLLLRSMPSTTTIDEATDGLGAGLYIVNGKKIIVKH